MKKYLLLAIVFGALLIGGALVQKNIRSSKAVLAESLAAFSVHTKAEEPKEIPPTRLTFVGDIMLGRGVKTSVYKNFGGDYARLFENMKPYFLADDITFANLEGPISAGGRNVGSKYSFRFEPQIAPILKDAGIDILSVANNHAGDWTVTAHADTLRYLMEAGVLFTGADFNYEAAIVPKVIEKNGMKFGFLGFTDVGPDWMRATASSAGVLLASDPNFDSIIMNASQQVDFLIVSFHFGVEYKVGSHTERQELLAHRAIDAGANAVIGHHPHVAEDTEMYHDGFIAYSLGNFIFDQKFSKDTMQGMVVELSINSTGIITPTIRTHVLNSFYQPTLE